MTTNEPIHDYEQRLVRHRRNIKLLQNGQTALHFIDHLSALGLSLARVTKYSAHMPVLLRMINTDLKTMTKQDVEAIVAAINTSKQKAWTKRDKKLVLRKLIQYAKVGSCAKGTPLPPEISWISLAVKEKDSRVTPESLLTPEDFTAIIKATTNKRDRAMVYVLFEAALRPGELLTMQISSVIFKDEYCLISANGKTGIKRIPLVISCKPLLEWLEDHPNKNKPESSLWCALDNNHLGKRLSYRHFRAIIKHLAKKAELKKDIWPYLYRHTSLTAMAKVFTEARLEQFAGWTYGSKMTSRYVHFSARDLEDAILELHGLKTTTKNTGIITQTDCPRCGNKNPTGKIRCTTCGMIIDKETALKVEETKRQKDKAEEKIRGKETTEFKERILKLEEALFALLQTQQNKTHPPLLQTQQ
ncbi:MAG: site-specific integrase [Candidatus Bathyarchaeota archaeon]|uniref:tyrosine-type recombinase/integrase n=1 Tax=Candidatus Bathycorpusculum sp. TaxID=2994959 RepID=UPI002820530B|nr:site-specific integrase [Candidatus Termiticorpusculum sp.]MCL2257080.1 site-specific integrase [Candidatus Termiticorpusculum sp.]MCL2292788.1 site-specific integrase [Candidatus Termiticorpusculum sp.]